jgi:hypothetical protein
MAPGRRNSEVEDADIDTRRHNCPDLERRLMIFAGFLLLRWRYDLVVDDLKKFAGVSKEIGKDAALTTPFMQFLRFGDCLKEPLGETSTYRPPESHQRYGLSRGLRYSAWHRWAWR